MPDEDFNISEAVQGVVDSGEVKMPEGGESSPAPLPDAPVGEGAAPTPTPDPEDPFPKSWKPDFQEKWKGLDPVVRKEILRREEDFHKGITGFREHAELGAKLRKAVEPYSAFFAATKLDPTALLPNFINAHLNLSRGGVEAAEFLRNLAAEYKIDLSAQPPYIDPQVKALQDEVAGVSSRLNQREQAELQARQDQIRKQIETFAADPKNDLFDQCSGEIAALLKANPSWTLEKAYEAAVWTNPTTREIYLQRQSKAQAEAKAEEERRRAAEAEAASRGSVRNPSRTAPETGSVGTMQDTMRETLAALTRR